MTKIKDIPKIDRPREKMVKKSEKALSDFELIQVLVGSGVSGSDVGQISKEILKKFKDNFENISLESLQSIKGMSLAKSAKIISAIEISKRFLTKDEHVIKKAEDVLSLVSEIRDKKQEYFICITLDGASRLINRRTITIGTLNASLVHPREVFADALVDRAAGVIFVHNHPSGNTEPSQEDIEITHQLMESGKILGIEIVDHIIVTKTRFSSFKDSGLLNEK
ncbi:MAG: DNA repair protein RadC [Candidatus Paceibacterota bacterium]